jgi:hypothetical protein
MRIHSLADALADAKQDMDCSGLLRLVALTHEITLPSMRLTHVAVRVELQSRIEREQSGSLGKHLDFDAGWL